MIIAPEAWGPVRPPRPFRLLDLETLVVQPEFFDVARQYPPEIAWPLLEDATRYDWQTQTASGDRAVQSLKDVAAHSFGPDARAQQAWIDYMTGRMVDAALFALWQDPWQFCQRHVTAAGQAVLARVRRDFGRMVAVSPHWDAYLSLPACLLADGWRVNCQTEPDVAHWWSQLAERYLASPERLRMVGVTSAGGLTDRLTADVRDGWSAFITPDYNLGERGPSPMTVPFVGGPLPATTGPARVAITAEVPLVGMTLSRVGPLAYRWEVAEPLYWPGDAPEDVDALTVRMYQYLAGEVRKNPTRWWGWMHAERAGGRS